MRAANSEEWTRAYDSAASRHIFLKPQWGQIVSRTFGLPLRTLCFDFADKTVIMPACRTNRLRLFMEEWRSMPPFQYGGLLSPKPLTDAEQRAIALRLSLNPRLHTMTVSVAPGTGFAGWRAYEENYFTTQVLNLSGGFDGVVRKLFSSQQRNRYKKGIHRGVTVRLDSTSTGLESFYALYQSSNARWGNRTPEPKELFEALLSSRENDVELMLASRGNEDIAAMIVGYDGRGSAYYLFGASNASRWECCPNNVLFTFAIERACGMGLSHFDFLPSGRIAGVERFKASFGAVRVPVHEYWLRGWFPTMKNRLLGRDGPAKYRLRPI